MSEIREKEPLMIKKINLSDECILAFCRLGFAGLSPKAPGTCGTALACILAPFVFLPLNFMFRFILLVILFLLGGIAATKAEKILGRKDPGQVVIDELVGVWVVLLPFAKADVWIIMASFIMFRIFDILKPWPVNASENWLPGGFGVMIDDVMAGLWAMICVAILYYLKII